MRGDSRGGAYRDHASLQTGYRRIGMITGPRTVSTAEERVAGYLDALDEMDVTVPDPDSLRALPRKLGLPGDPGPLSGHPRPDALCGSNNFIALGVLEALRELDLRVPEDIALVCFDDFPRLGTTVPFLTTVVQPAAEIGRVAIQLLLDRLAGPNLDPRDVVLPPG